MSQDTHALSGAYALDALSPEEAERFEEHLQGCDPCRAEVAEFREVAARLGARTVESPPSSLRAKVLAHADRTRQHPPPPRLAEASGVVTPLRRRRWVSGLLAAAALLVAAGFGANALLDRDQEPQEPALAAPVTQVFEAEDAESVEVDLEGGVLRVAVSEERGEMAVDARELPDPGEGRVYQLWTGHGGEMINAGVLAPTDTGAAMPLPSPGDTVNVTVEPAGGSDQPTSAPIATVDPTDI